jgi:hypothetical protein
MVPMPHRQTLQLRENRPTLQPHRQNQIPKKQNRKNNRGGNKLSVNRCLTRMEQKSN